MNLLWNRYTRGTQLRLMQSMPIHRDRVLCICWGGETYGCNPGAIAEQLAQRHDYEVWFAFRNPERYRTSVPDGIHCVELGSLPYFRLLATARFVISNTRLAGGWLWPFAKRKGQYYIQTMHGGHGIKRLEWDVAETLSDEYLQLAETDRQATDLMLSDSSYLSQIYRTAFRYRGEVLEEGLPQNDRLAGERQADDLFASSKEERRYLLYAPTFRSQLQPEVYRFDIDRVVEALEQRFGGTWYIRLSVHPNLRSGYQQLFPLEHPRLLDHGRDDLQPLLLSSQALLTDYSSAAMDFALLHRPVFQYCRDRHTYDRGFYILPEDLPFPYAEDERQLIDNILHFNLECYLHSLHRFHEEVIGLRESGHATESVIGWMDQHR